MKSSPTRSQFVDRARKDGKPFFLWLNPTRMHVVTHLSPKYEAMRNSDNNWTLQGRDGADRRHIQEAGMAQIDDIVGSVMKYVKDAGIEGDTIIGFTTDNGAENFTWPDGGQTPFAGGKGTALEGGFRVPMILRWPGKVPAGKVENGIVSGMDWFPTFVAAAGNPNITDELLKGKQLGDKTYKVHLDGYNQMDLITGKGPSKRHEIFYFTESTLSAVRINDFKYRFTDQPRRMAGRHGPEGRLADPDEPAPRPVRAHRTCRTVRMDHLRSTTGSCSSSGASSSCSRRWRRSRRPRSSSRRCSRARASTSRPSRLSSRKPAQRTASRIPFASRFRAALLATMTSGAASVFWRSSTDDDARRLEFRSR